MNVSNNGRKHKDQSVTIRFNSDVMKSIDRLAHEYGVTRSDIIRLASEDSLSKYLDRVRYINPDQGRYINMNIEKLGNEMSEVLYNLRRIGANFDQLLHRVNAGQIQGLQSRGELVKRKDLDEMLTRMEKVADKVGENLHVFTN